VLSPLAVARQTVREGEKFGIQVTRCNDGNPAKGINVTNYEKLHHFDPKDFVAVVCDESSILKSFDGKRKSEITEFMRTMKYRLLCTATAAPNDYVELGTSQFFKNDQNTCDSRMIRRRAPGMGGPISRGWRFKGHAETPFWRYVCSWSRAARNPSDWGFPDDRFVLLELIEREHIVDTRTLADGYLFALPATNMREERDERRRTIQERCEKAAALVRDTGEPAVIWCHLNAEGDLLEKMIPDGMQISGAMSDEEKEDRYEAFSTGKLRVLIIKPKIGAWGLNWQHCNHVVSFASHSYEQYYQAVRRCWRFGQKRDVISDLIATEGERGAKENMQRKSEAADRMFSRRVEHMGDALKVDGAHQFDKKAQVPAWL
jgi:hypothetical protein